MKHIIDTDELEKLQQYVMIDMTNGVEQCKHGDYVHIDDLRALIANSPQADGIKLKPVSYANSMDILSYRNNYSVTEEKTKTNTVPLYTQDQVDVMLSAYKPQADDVRKDADDTLTTLAAGIKRLPRFTFLSPKEGGVKRFQDISGNWIERHEVMKLIEIALGE